jgi:hypothetical protein
MRRSIKISFPAFLYKEACSITASNKREIRSHFIDKGGGMGSQKEELELNTTRGGGVCASGASGDDDMWAHG